jgi:flotillin
MMIIIVLIIVVLIVIQAIRFTVNNLLYVSAPNQALIFSGSRRLVGQRTIGYRIVRGGRSLRMPLFEKVDSIDLSNMTIDLEVKGAFSKGGIPLNVHGIANVKLPGEEPLLNNAIERFLGRSANEIYSIAKETLEGNLRGVLAQLSPEEVNADKARFAQILLDEAEHDLNRIGLVLDTLKVLNVADDVGYLRSIGRIRGATVKMEATIAEARAQADAAEQQAKNWGASEVAKIKANWAVAERDISKRMTDAQTQRGAMIAEAQGEVLAQLSSINAEIERQKARALQVQRKLDADVVQPAVADQKAQEEAARADATAIIERGKADAIALRALVEVFKTAGPSAREVLALQQLRPLLADIAGAKMALEIGKVTLLPAHGAGSELAKLLIGASKQVQAATGVDLASTAASALTKKPT